MWNVYWNDMGFILDYEPKDHSQIPLLEITALFLNRSTSLKNNIVSFTILGTSLPSLIILFNIITASVSFSDLHASNNSIIFV